MKKLLFIATIFLCMFNSCSDSSENTVLNDTIWKSTEEYNGVVYAEWILKFYDGVFSIDLQQDMDGDGIFEESDSATGSYTVDGNKIDLSSENLQMHGSFDDNVMNLVNINTEDKFTYYKQ